jgi:hypothetical protein
MNKFSVQKKSNVKHIIPRENQNKKSESNLGKNKKSKNQTKLIRIVDSNQIWLESKLIRQITRVGYAYIPGTTSRNLNNFPLEQISQFLPRHAYIDILFIR